MNKGIATMLTVTLFSAGAWSADTYHGKTVHPTRRDATRLALSPAPVTDSASGWSALPYPLLDDPTANTQKDRYGNDISDAIAKYTSDRAGSVYEEHSPNTEVPHLKPPTT